MSSKKRLQYFAFYNGERPHQSLGQQTPNIVYRSAIGGGAMIVDKFGGAVEESPVERSATGDSSTPEPRSEATATTESKAKTGQRRPAASEVECAAQTEGVTVLTQGATSGPSLHRR